MWIELTNSTTGKKFKARGITDFTISRDSGITDLPLPEQNSDSVVLIKLFGTKESYSIGFTLTQQDQDDAQGYDVYMDTNGVTSYPNRVRDQITYIKDNFITSTSTHVFKVKVTDGTNHLINDPSGIFTNLQITYRVAADAADVRLTFVMGTVA